MFTDIKRRVSRLGSISSSAALEMNEKQTGATLACGERQGMASPTTSHISLSDQSDHGLSNSSGITSRQSHGSSSSSTVSIPMPQTPSGQSTRSLASRRGSHGGATGGCDQRLRSIHSTQSFLGDPCFDHSHLKPGTNAALLSYTKTIDMYRANCRRTQDPNVRCSFAIFLVEASKRIPGQQFLQEAEKILRHLALRGHTDAQYYLANLYVSGITDHHDSHTPDFGKAFPLYVHAAKHSHADAAYRAGKCYEEGLGTRRDLKKAMNLFRKAATLNHPGAMYSLGMAELHGQLGTARRVRDGFKWLKRSAETATPVYPHALHELGRLHEKGFDNVIFADSAYAVKLYSDAADLGHAPSAYRLGQIYEFGYLQCPPNPPLSLFYYSAAAHHGHAEACFAMTTWYLVGIPGIATQSDEQAWTWAHRAAEKELPIAYNALGYFCEVGIGRDKNLQEAIHWYAKAAERGVKRAARRLTELGATPPPLPPIPTATASHRPLSTLLLRRRKSPSA